MNEQTKAQVEAYAEECRTEQLELLRTLGKMPAPTRREDFRAAFCPGLAPGTRGRKCPHRQR